MNRYVWVRTLLWPDHCAVHRSRPEMWGVGYTVCTSSSEVEYYTQRDTKTDKQILWEGLIHILTVFNNFLIFNIPGTITCCYTI